MSNPLRPSNANHPASPDNEQVRAANRKGDMGPGEAGGGYGRQRFDTDRHGGSYGSNESSGGSYTGQHGLDGSDPLAARPLQMGMQHMAGRHGDQAYGRIDAPSGTRIPIDPSQRNFGDLGGEPRKDSESQNAQIVGGSGALVGQGAENERNAPGISTDKNSDDTKG